MNEPTGEMLFGVMPKRARMITHAVFGMLIAAYVLVFWTTLMRLMGVWAGDGTFQYGFLIMPISLFLVWTRRQALAVVPFKPSYVGAGLVAVCSGLWLLGTLVGVQLVEQFAVIALLPSMVLAVYGFALARALMFPLLYLFFAFPWPVGHLVVILQYVTAEIAVRALQLTGFVAYLHDVMIETPVAVWHVAVACSGIKFFLAMVALGLLYAHLFFRSPVRRVVFVLLAFIVPIFFNGLRVYFTVVIGEVFGVQYATGTDHMIFGWQFFGTVLLLYFLAGWPWRESGPDDVEVAPTPTPASTAGRPALAAPLLLVFLLSGPLLGWAIDAADATPVAPPTPAARIGAWQLTLASVDAVGARFHRADSYFAGTYTNGRKQVNVVVAGYLGRPRHGHKLLMVSNRRYDPAQWKEVESSSRVQPAGKHRTQALRQVMLAEGGYRRLVWYWYEVNGQTALNAAEVKWLQLSAILRGRPVVTRVVMLSTPLEGDQPASEATLDDFLRAMAASVHEASTHGNRR